MATVAEEATILCLTNSVKYGGRCIAGVRTNGFRRGEWLRPVGMTDQGELYRKQYELPDGTDPQIGDVLRIPLYDGAPIKGYHPEDRRVAGSPWRLLQRPAPADKTAQLLEAVTVAGPNLFGCRESRIDSDIATRRIGQPSLALVRPQRVYFAVTLHERPGESPERKYRLRFELGAAVYNLPLTDPGWRQILSEARIGLHDAAKFGLPKGLPPYLVCSLGEPHTDGYCYKLVASVFPAPSEAPEH